MTALLAYSSEHPGILQNIQIPIVRFVYAPDWLLENVVRNCCDTSKRCVLCLDTTYNIGPFYVTPTTYTRKDVLHRETKKPATFPGPAMIHATKEDGDFFYFAATLAEQNRSITTCKFIGGDRDSAQKSFTALFPNHVFVPCTKHVKDDIIRQLGKLHLTNMKERYIEDIFGCHKKQKKGLMDAVDDDGFESHLEALYDEWDEDFVKYFDTNIKCDMKSGMLLPLRQHLGIDRFYNNGNECMNKKYKNLVKEYVAKTKGTVRTRSYKLSYVEAVEVYAKLCKNHSLDLAASVYDEGTYELTGANAEHQINGDKWNEMNPRQRRELLKRIDCYYKKGDLI